MGRTLIRTDQLSNTLRQTFSNLSGLEPIFDFNFNGLSTGGQTLYKAVIEKSPFSNAPDYPIGNPNAQALERILNKDDTGNRWVIWIDLDKPTIPANQRVGGIYVQNSNTVKPRPFVVDISAVDVTPTPYGYIYGERKGTADARAFYAADARSWTDVYNSTGWVGYISIFKSPAGVGFQALNRGIDVDVYGNPSIGFLAQNQTQAEDVAGVVKLGFVSRLDRSAAPSASTYLIGYRATIADTSGTTTYYNSGFEVGIFGSNKSTVSESTGFKVFGNGTIQNFTGFSFSDNGSTDPINNTGCTITLKSKALSGGSVFGYVSNIIVQSVDEAGTTKVGYIAYLNRPASSDPNVYLLGYRVNIQDVGIAGNYNSGFEVGVFRGFQSVASNSTGFKVFGNGNMQNFTGFQYDEMNFSNPLNNIAFASYIKSDTSIGYLVMTFTDITSNYALGMLFGKLGTATDINQYNSFTTRWTSSNWNTGTSAVEDINWDVRAIGVSGNPPNSRFGVFGDGTELFNVQKTGDIEVTTVDKGIILKSPTGIRYRVKVTDAGGLVTEAV